MNNDGRTTSEQLYIPSLLIVGGSQSLLLRCLHASKTMGLAIKACSPAEATAIVARRHPIAIIVPNDVFAAERDLAPLARDVRSALLTVDPEVSVRELEAMIAAAVDGGFSQRERRGGMGRYSIVDGAIEEEAPFSRRTLPPTSTRSPGIVSTRPPAPPMSVRPSAPPMSVRPTASARAPLTPDTEAMLPEPARPSMPPMSVRASVPPAPVRASVPPAPVRASVPPASGRPSALPASGVRPAAPPPAERSSVVPAAPRPSVVPASRTLPSMPAVTAPAPAAAAASSESVPPASGVPKVAVGAFAAIRSVFTSRR
jgi:hypothetical protein